MLWLLLCCVLSASALTVSNGDEVWRTSRREGANALYLWLRLHDAAPRYGQIVELLDSQYPRPLSLAHLRDAACRNGVNAVVRRGHTDDIIKGREPVIVYLDGNDGQRGFFALVLMLNDQDDVFLINTSAVLLSSMRGDDFRRVWTGHYLAVAPRPPSAPWWVAGFTLLLAMGARSGRHLLGRPASASVVSPEAKGRGSLVGVLLGGFLTMSGCVQSGATPAPPIGSAQEAADLPFTLTRRSIPRLDLPDGEVQAIRVLSFPLKEGMSASLVLHVLHAHGLEARFGHASPASGGELLKLFTDDRAGIAFFGEPVVSKTRHGIRCAVAPSRRSAREHHRDQALGVFSELGLPLSTPFTIAGEAHSLREMLDDSLANYSSRQVEVDWTAFAYALYLPPKRSWTNKYGEPFTFDDLAESVMARPLGSGSCAGSHLVWAMIALVRVDQEHTPILSPPVREKLRTRLKEVVRGAVESQRPDGSWWTDWHSSLSPSDARPGVQPNHSTLASRLLATSHIPEWLMHLPEEIPVPVESIHRASGWLYQQWREVQSTDFVAEHFCPCSHAAAVLSAICGEDVGTGEPALHSQ